jgi:hypothetical protein
MVMVTMQHRLAIEEAVVEAEEHHGMRVLTGAWGMLMVVVLEVVIPMTVASGRKADVGGVFSMRCKNWIIELCLEILFTWLQLFQFVVAVLILLDRTHEQTLFLLNWLLL